MFELNLSLIKLRAESNTSANSTSGNEFADADNADSDEIADLHQKISKLEEENHNIIQENMDYLQQTNDLTTFVDELSSGLADLKNQTDLEGEISRLHRDLEESRAEFSGLKSKLDGRDDEFEIWNQINDCRSTFSHLLF